MNPYREAVNIIDKAKAEVLGGNAAAWQFLDNAAMYCWRIARQQESEEFNREFREFREVSA